MFCLEAQKLVYGLTRRKQEKILLFKDLHPHHTLLERNNLAIFGGYFSVFTKNKIVSSKLQLASNT